MVKPQALVSRVHAMHVHERSSEAEGEELVSHLPGSASALVASYTQLTFFVGNDDSDVTIRQSGRARRGCCPMSIEARSSGPAPPRVATHSIPSFAHSTFLSPHPQPREPVATSVSSVDPGSFVGLREY